MRRGEIGIVSDFEGLSQAIASGRAVVIVGAGASVYATGNAPTASWTGLIRNGIAFVQEHESSDTTRWTALIEQQLEFALEEGDEDQLLQAASGVASRIHRMGEQAFARWLESAVGDFTVSNRELGLAIKELRSPIFTTNYDRILEEITGLPGVDWTDARGFQSILADAGSIGHLHGIFTNPQSVVLSAADYERQGLSEPVQALQKAISATKSVIYIGCGGTLSDPNFSTLLEWHRSVFQESAITHYRLCISQELPALRARHRDDHIVPIAFGDTYPELAEFVRSLAPGPASDQSIVRDSVHESREYILDQLRSETVIGEGLPDLEDRTLHDITIPPVLLPVPHGEFIRSKNEAGAKLERLSPLQSVEPDGVILIVGDESSGLSTAIRWMLHEGSVARITAAAQYVDFRSVGPGKRPLERLLRREAIYRGLVQSKKAALPEMVLGIDNFSPGDRGARVAEEIAERSGLTIIGCRTANEATTIDTLRSAGVQPNIVYLGKLESRDIKAMVALVSSKADSLATSIMTTLNAEHLPRTPFTISLIIAIMLRGEKLIANASPTTILEQYVGILLGRDDPDQDSTRSLTQASRESILSDLAVLFLDLDEGAVLQSDATARMEQFFERFAWPESPADVLADLAQRRVLVFEERRVRFAQSSFLHLFVARAAIRSGEVRTRLLQRPIYYSAVIRAYAALVRSDADLLRELVPLVEDLWSTEDPRSPFSERAAIAAPADLEERLSKADLSGDEAVEDASGDDSVDSDHPFDRTDDLDVHPFPLSPEDDLPRLARFAQGLELVSTVLRDSELVDDLKLKQSALTAVLRGWGHLIDALIEDDAFREATSAIRSKLEGANTDTELDERSIETFVAIFPMVLAFTGLEVTLASRTLLIIVNRMVDDDEAATSEARLAIPTAMLTFLLAEPGWEDRVIPIARDFEKTGAVQDFFYVLLLFAYAEAPVSSRTELKLRDVLTDIYVSRWSYEGREHRSRIRSAFVQHISRLKAIGELSPPELDAPEDEIGEQGG